MSGSGPPIHHFRRRLRTSKGEKKEREREEGEGEWERSSPAKATSLSGTMSAARPPVHRLTAQRCVPPYLCAGASGRHADACRSGRRHAGPPGSAAVQPVKQRRAAQQHAP